MPRIHENIKILKDLTTFELDAKHPNEKFNILANISKYIPLPASNRRSRSLRSGPPVNTSIRTIRYQMLITPFGGWLMSVYDI